MKKKTDKLKAIGIKKEVKEGKGWKGSEKDKRSIPERLRNLVEVKMNQKRNSVRVFI